MTPAEWVGQLSRSVGGIPPTDRDALGRGLAELLSAREPPKVAPIGPGVRFEYIATGGPFAGVWTVIDTPDGLNLSCHGETWWNSHPARRSTADDIRALTDRIEDGMRLWRRLPDEPGHAAELAAKDKLIAMLKEDRADQCRIAKEALDARDHAEARTAELEQAIRVLIGKLEA